jgi:hypothetical protein
MMPSICTTPGGFMAEVLVFHLGVTDSIPAASMIFFFLLG